MTQTDIRTTAPIPCHAKLKQAAHWYALLRDGKAGMQDRLDWEAWLSADKVHLQAWQYIEDISQNFKPLGNQPDSRMAVDALSTATHRLSRRRLLAGATVVVTGGILGGFIWSQAQLSTSIMALGANYRTGTGEQREITLADGTRVWLNTASAINVSFDIRERAIELVLGELFIETAQGDTRPFLVETKHGRMQALGTRFNVWRDPVQTRLAVYAGAVEIRTAISRTTRIVPAGQQVHFNAGDINVSEAADDAREAWAQGTMVADNISLGELINELRRYRSGHLGIADDVAGLKVYGNFPIGDTDRVLSMLASALPIRIEQPMPWWTTVKAKR